jgi:uncharacterized membrane protein
MEFAPLLTAKAPIPLHASAAGAAVLLGTLQLLRAKGDAAHRLIGAAWVALMVAVAGSSLWIRSDGWSPIHLLSVGTLLSLVYALWAVHAGRRAIHGRSMQWIFAMALVVTGVFTLLPGRIMHAVLFGAG